MDLINLIVYLYWNKESPMSTYQISELLECDAELVRANMIEHGIPRRSAHDPYYNKLRAEELRKRVTEYHKNPKFLRKNKFSSKKRWQDPEFRNMMIEKMKKYRNKPEVKEARRKLSIKLWNAPEMREKIIKGMFLGQLPREHSIEVLRTIRCCIGMSIAEITILIHPEMSDFVVRKRNKRWIKFRDHVYNSLLTLMKRKLITKEMKTNTIKWYWGMRHETWKFYINVKGINFLEQINMEEFGKFLTIFTNIRKCYW